MNRFLYLVPSIALALAAIVLLLAMLVWLQAVQL